MIFYLFSRNLDSCSTDDPDVENIKKSIKVSIVILLSCINYCHFHEREIFVFMMGRFTILQSYRNFQGKLCLLKFHSTARMQSIIIVY